jgi:hypothetical protein
MAAELVGDSGKSNDRQTLRPTFEQVTDPPVSPRQIGAEPRRGKPGSRNYPSV